MFINNAGYDNYFMRENDFFRSPVQSLSDSYVNGMDAMIMQSSEDADKVIAMFDSAIQQGYHPEVVEQDIYEQLNINPDNLTDFDKVRISHAVNKLWSEANY